MSFNQVPWVRPPAPRPKPDPQPNLSEQALAEMRAAELESRPFGSYGELTVPAVQPTIALPARPVIPPPDWEEERAEREAREHEEAALAEEVPGTHPPVRREPS